MSYYEMKENVEKLPYPWFGVNFGYDGYEEAITIDDIDQFHASMHHIHDNEGTALPQWEITVYITKKTGREYKILLNEKGYDAFLRALKPKKSVIN